MLSKKVQVALNEQIRNEMYASYLYLSMSAFCESSNLQGMARWMRLQSEEERQHALKIFDFINDRDGRIDLQAIDKPPAAFKSPLDVFEKALEHERSVTKQINKLYGLAVKEEDYATQALMQWFVTEQVEEESTIGRIVGELKLAGTQGAALFMLDQQLAARRAEQDGEG